jgi:hypothetical protein
MTDSILRRMIFWAAISIGVGVAFNIGWAVVFWNDDNMWPFHWLGLPLGIVVFLLGGNPFRRFR